MDPKMDPKMAPGTHFGVHFGPLFGTPPGRSRLPYVWILAQKGPKRGPKMDPKMTPKMGHFGVKMAQKTVQKAYCYSVLCSKFAQINEAFLTPFFGFLALF